MTQQHRKDRARVVAFARGGRQRAFDAGRRFRHTVELAARMADEWAGPDLATLIDQDQGAPWEDLTAAVQRELQLPDDADRTADVDAEAAFLLGVEVGKRIRTGEPAGGKR